MRLPWPFVRRSGRPEPTGHGAVAQSATGQVPGPTAAWRSLPTIQRALGEPRLVAPSALFLRSMPGTRALPHSVEPLGHLSSPLAPVGLVVARARSGGLPAAATPAASPTIQRGAGRPLGETEPRPSEAAGTVAVDEVSSIAHDPAQAPVRRLAVIPRADVDVPTTPLTRADGVDADRSAQGRAPKASPTPSSALPSTPGLRRARPTEGGAVRPVVSRQSASPSVTSPDPGPAATAAPTGAGRDEAATVRAGPAGPPPRPRRTRLGAPLAVAPMAPLASRAALAPDRAGPSGSAAIRDDSAVVQRTAAAPVDLAAIPWGSEPADARPAGSSGTDTIDHRLPVLPVLRVSPRSSRQEPAGPIVSPPSRGAARAPQPDIRPTLGHRPARPATVQRRTEHHEEPTRAAAPGATVPSPGLGGSTSGAGPSPRTPFRSTTAPAILAQISPGSAVSAPPAYAPAGQRVIQRASAARLMLAHPRGSTDATVSAQTWPAATGQPPTVQTLPAGPSSGSVPTLAATPVLQRVEDPGPVPDEEPLERSEDDLDELARALFGRIRGQLRSELIHEREAKGLIFDNL